METLEFERVTPGINTRTRSTQQGRECFREKGLERDPQKSSEANKDAGRTRTEALGLGSAASWPALCAAARSAGRSRERTPVLGALQTPAQCRAQRRTLVMGQLGPWATRRRRQDLALACRPLRAVL